MLRELELYEACPLCASARFEPYALASCATHALYKPQLTAQMTWMRCDDCGHVFRNGYYTPEALAIIFADTHDRQRVGHEMELQRVVSARMVEKVAAQRPRGRHLHQSWLDVGFGSGALLMTAQEFGFEPVGLDLRADNVRALNEFGIEAHCVDIADLDCEARFDVVSMADVLEHIAYPVKALRKAWALLKPGGVLFASMPNMDAPVWRVMDAANANPYWKELEHYHNFGRSRLYSLLAECGFHAPVYGVSERYRACMEVISVKG